MENQKQQAAGFVPRIRAAGFIVLFLLAISCMGVLPVAAGDFPLFGVIPSKSDIGNLAFANRPSGYYYFKFNQEGGGGLNALHIASNTASSPNYGDVSTATSQSGTFYITDTGGRGYQDEAILLVAVADEIPDDFSIHIRSSGYSWTPTGVQDTPPTLPQITYKTGATDQTFTKAQFVYGPQTWKPAGNNEPSDYPLYCGQDMADTSRKFSLMFVDLNTGPLGPNSKFNRVDAIDVSTLTDNGAIKVEYAIENLDSAVVFNVYAFNDNTTQGHGISWANRVVGTGCSGYTVLGPDYEEFADDFPTAGGVVPIYHGPETDFQANVTSGDAPLVVQFTDTTAQSVSSRTWDFGDGETSDEKNPVHVYAAEGSYTVSLTAANNQGITTTKTETDYITVTEAPAADTTVYSPSDRSSTGENGPGPSGDGSLVGFTANVTEGPAPLAVRFANVSLITDIADWSWDFTEDNLPDSSDPDPIYIFAAAGNYTVNLTVLTFSGNAYNLTLPEYIRVTEAKAPSGDPGVATLVQSGTATGVSATGRQLAAPPAATPAATAAPVATVSYSPLGMKVAKTLLDAMVVIIVIGAGIFLWKRQ